MTEGNELFKPLPRTQEELAQYLGQCAAAVPKVLSAKGKAEGSITPMDNPWSLQAAKALAAEAERRGIYGTLPDRPDPAREEQTNRQNIY